MTGYPLAGQRALAEIVSPGPWIAFTLQNSWSNTGGGIVTAQYRLWPLMNELEFIGNVSHAAIAGTSLFAASLVAPYVPASQQTGGVQKVIATNQFAAQTSGPFVVIPTTGAIQFQFLPAGTTQVEFHCFFSMDA
jgi:hypothetical protein